MGSFDSLEAAGRAVAAISVVLSALEFIDRTCIEAVDAWQGLGQPQVEALLARVDEVGAAGDASTAQGRPAALPGASRSSGVPRPRRPIGSPRPAPRLSGARTARPGAHRGHLRPRGRVPEMLARIQASARDHDVVIANIAHAVGTATRTC